jgi:hypothetical protein
MPTWRLKTPAVNPVFKRSNPDDAPYIPAHNVSVAARQQFPVSEIPWKKHD